MYEVVEFWRGGYCEEVVHTAETLDGARAWCDAEGYRLGDDHGEDGTYIRTPSGEEVWE